MINYSYTNTNSDLSGNLVILDEDAKATLLDVGTETVAGTLSLEPTSDLNFTLNAGTSGKASLVVLRNGIQVFSDSTTTGNQIVYDTDVIAADVFTVTATCLI